MDIRCKLYPYPVLSYYTDDYENSHFDTVISPERDGFDIRISFLANLVNDELAEMIASSKVKIVYHLECAQTGYRTTIPTINSKTVHLISNKLVSGRLQICPFIVANEDIPSYVNSCFHPDYRGFKFSIEAGCVMAVGRQVNIDIDKEINDLSNTSSVFSIIKNDDETAQGMIVDLDHKKIIIKLPEQEFFNYKSLKDEATIQPVLNSLVVIPALTYVLEEVVKRDASERYEYSSYSWYRAVKKALAARFSCDIDSDQMSEKNMLEIAQKLINVPLADSLKVLSDGYGDISEEDDE
jgi:hypothetical protein